MKMEKFNKFLDEKFMPVAAKIADQKHLQSIRDGLVLGMPLIIVGSLFLIIASLPISGYPEFMAKIFGDAWEAKLLYPVSVSFDLLGVIAVIGISYRLAEKYKVEPLSASIVAFASFLLLTPFKLTTFIEKLGENITLDAIPLTYLGSQGLFVAILIAIISTEIYRKIIQKGIVIKMPEGVPPAVSISFVALIPAAVIITCTWIIRLLIESTVFGNIHEIMRIVLGKPLSYVGGSFAGALIATFMISLLWSVGLHGADIVCAVLNPIWYVFMDQNRLAFLAGKELPNIMTAQFVDIWVSIGGSGTTIVLAILLFFKARSKQLKQIGKLSLAPGLFNINEPIIFGMPIVMNPIMMVPFILAPVVSTAIGYISMHIGLVAKPAGIAVPWTIPPIIGGYLATGGKISGAILQLVQMLVAGIIYYPFFKRWDEMKCAEEALEESKNN